MSLSIKNMIKLIQILMLALLFGGHFTEASELGGDSAVNGRDPFKPFIKLRPKLSGKTPLSEDVPAIKRFPLDKYKIVGIVIREKGKSKALIVDPEKNSHFLGKNDEIGNNSGKIIAVSNNGLVVKEKVYTEDDLGRLVAREKETVLDYIVEDN